MCSGVGRAREVSLTSAADGMRMIDRLANVDAHPSQISARGRSAPMKTNWLTRASPDLSLAASSHQRPYLPYEKGAHAGGRALLGF